MTPLFFPCQDITPLQVVLPNTALHLKALLDFEDKNGQKVVAGDEWLFEGPGKCFPIQPGLGSEASCLLIRALMSSDLQTPPPSSSLPRHIYPPEGGGGHRDHSGHGHQAEPGPETEGSQGMLRQGWQGAGDRWGLEALFMGVGQAEP